MKWLAIVVLCVACNKQAEDAPPPSNNDSVVPDAELKRGQDACNAYLAKACACGETVPAAKDACAKASALPEALKMATEVTMSKDSNPKDVKQAAMTIRATIKSCIEQTAQLPALGCPP